MAKATQPKNATITKVNKVFAGKENSLREDILAVFDLLSRKEIQFGTPGEKKRFEAAYVALQNANIVVSDAEVKIETGADQARKVAAALAVPDKEGNIVEPAVEDVLDAEKLPDLILDYARHTSAFKKVMQNINSIKDKDIVAANANYYKALAEVEELTKRVNGLKQEVETLKKENEELKAENAELDKQANYITPSGKRIKAKTINKIVIPILAVALGFSLAFNIGQAVRNQNLQNDIVVAGQLLKDKDQKIADLQDQVLDLQDGMQDLQDEIDDHHDRYQAVVDMAQLAGIQVADDVKIEDLFTAIIDSVNNGTATSDAQLVYAKIAIIMQDYGITEADLKGSDGKYSADKIEAEIREAFTNAIEGANTIAGIEKAVTDSLEGSGKKLSDFASLEEAIEFAHQYHDDKIEKLEETISDQSSTIASQNKTIEQLRKQIANSSDAALIAQLTADVSRLEAENAALSAQLDAAKSSLSSLQTSYNTLNGKYQDALQQIDGLNAIIAQKDAAYDDLLDENERLQGIINSNQNNNDGSIQTPSDNTSDNEAGNVNVGETDKDDERNNAGSKDQEISKPGGEMGAD